MVRFRKSPWDVFEDHSKRFRGKKVPKDRVDKKVSRIWYETRHNIHAEVQIAGYLYQKFGNLVIGCNKLAC